MFSFLSVVKLRNHAVKSKAKGKTTSVSNNDGKKYQSKKTKKGIKGHSRAPLTFKIPLTMIAAIVASVDRLRVVYKSRFWLNSFKAKLLRRAVASRLTLLKMTPSYMRTHTSYSYNTLCISLPYPHIKAHSLTHITPLPSY